MLLRLSNGSLSHKFCVHKLVITATVMRKKFVQWLKTRKTETLSAGRPSTNIQSTTPPERRDRKKGKFPIAWTITLRASLSDQIIRTAGGNSSLAQPTDHSKVLSGWFQLFVCLFFIAPTTSLWGLMGNYKIKNIKNLENLHTVFMNFTAANKILFY